MNSVYRYGGGMVFALVAVLFAAVVSFPAAVRAEGPSVAVFPIKNNGQAQYDGLASGLSVMFTTDLKKSDALDVVEPQKVYDAIRRMRLEGGAPKAADALKAARDVGADYAMTGEFVLFGGKFRIDVRLYDVAAGTIRFADKAQDKEDALFDKVDALSNNIIIELVGSLPSPKGALAVGTVPGGATVYVDEVKAGVTPLTLNNIERGQHEVTLELDGFKPHTERVTVSDGETTEIDVELEPLFGGVRVWWSELPTSDISFGEYTVAMGHFQYNPFAMYCKNYPVGVYRVTVRMPYKDEGSWEEGVKSMTYTADVEVRAGEVTDVFINNKVFSPGIEVYPCPACADTWDFDTDIVWYESK